MVARVDGVPPGATAIGRWLFVLALSVYVFTAGGSLTSTDAVQAFDITRNIVEHGSITMTDSLAGAEALRGRDGHFYSPFGIVQSLYNIPFYLAGKTVAASTGVHLGKPDTLPKAAVAMGQTLVGAVIVWQIFWFGAHVTRALGPSMLAALTFAFGSVLWPYARFGFNQPLACMTLLAAVGAAWLGVRRSEPRRVAAAGWWFAAGLMTRHELGLAILPLLAWLWLAGAPSLGERRRRLVAFAPGLVAGIVAWLAFNAIRFGNPFDSGHLRDPIPGFGSPVVDGLLGLLFSPSSSIFLYSPVAVLGLAGLAVWLWRADRATAAWLLSIVALFLVFYATLGNWIGGRSYGSRYLVIVLPYFAVGWAALLAAIPRGRRRALFAVLFVVGVGVQLPGVLVDYAKVSQTVTSARGAFLTTERQWAWEAAPLVLNARALAVAVPANLRYVSGRAPVPEVATSATVEDRGFSQQFAFSLDLWWLYLFYMVGMPPTALLLFVAAGLAWLAFASRQLVRAQAAAGPDETTSGSALGPI